MKRLVAAAFFVLGAPVGLSAQVIRFDIKAGGSVTTLVGPGAGVGGEVLPLVGFVGGVFRTFALSPTGRVFLQAELLYSQQGYCLSHPPTDYAATLRSTYVCLPLPLTYAHRGFFMEAGPQLGYLAGVRERFRFQQPNGAGPAVRFNTDPSGHPRWDLAGMAGVGYRQPSGLGIEVRYVGSFTSIYYPSGGLGSRARPRHAGIQLQVSYLLSGH